MTEEQNREEKQKQEKKKSPRRRWGLILTWVGIIAWLVVLFGDLPYRGELYNLMGSLGMVAFIIAIILYIREYMANADKDLQPGQADPTGGIFIMSQVILILSLILIYIFLFVVGG